MSASMRTALLVYSGITVKMMVDSDLGALLTTMFMVQYDPAGVAGPHDHPFEETYLFLEGEAEAVFDGQTYGSGRRRRLRRRRLRARLQQRRRRPGALAGDPGAAAAGPPLLPVRPGLGLPALSDRHSTGRTLTWPARCSSSAAPPGSAGSWPATTPAGAHVVLTGRDAARAAKVAAEIGGRRTRHRARPRQAARRSRRNLAGVGPVDHLVLAAIDRDANTVADYNIDGARSTS